MIDTALPYSDQQRGSKKKKTGLMIGAGIIIAVLVGSIFVFRQPKWTDQTKVSVVEKKGPSPTAKPKIDKKSVQIQVLNGTGTPGQAGIAVEVIEKVGYNPDNIKTDNAEEFNNTITTIDVKDGFDDVASDIKDALKTTFDEIKINSAYLDSDNEFDIIITTGGKKFEEATPTTSTTPTQSPSPSPTNEVITTTPTPTLTPTPTP